MYVINNSLLPLKRASETNYVDFPNKQFCTEENRILEEYVSSHFEIQRYDIDRLRNPNLLLRSKIDVALNLLRYDPARLTEVQGKSTLEFIAELSKEKEYSETIQSIFKMLNEINPSLAGNLSWRIKNILLSKM